MVKRLIFSFQVFCALFLQDWLIRDAPMKRPPDLASEPRVSTFVLVIPRGLL